MTAKNHRVMELTPISGDSTPSRRLNVGFVLAPQFTMLALSGFVDTLRLAADDGDRSRPIHCAWSVVSHDLKPVRASCGIEVVPTTRTDSSETFDYLVIVGGLLGGPPLAREMRAYIRKSAAHDVPLIGVCTGSFILAELGLLNRRRCCISWFHHAEFRQRFPTLQATAEELFVIDGNRITCAGGASVLHLAAHLVSRHCGPGNARKALRIMIEPIPLPSVAPQPPPPIDTPVDDPRVRKAMLLIERNLGSPLPIEFVANHVGISKRTLERLFKATTGMRPTEFTQRLRLSAACQMLTKGHSRIADIALQCGFSSHSHFAKSFRAAFGTSPSRFRPGV